MQGVSLSDELRYVMSTFILYFIMCSFFFRWVERNNCVGFMVSIRKSAMHVSFSGKTLVIRYTSCIFKYLFRDQSYRLYCILLETLAYAER